MTPIPPPPTFDEIEAAGFDGTLRTEQPIWELVVELRGTPLRAKTINQIMEAADPGHWGLDHPLRWSNRLSAAHNEELVRFTFGRRYVVHVRRVDR